MQFVLPSMMKVLYMNMYNYVTETVAFENKDGRPVISVKEASQEKKDCLIKQNLYIKEKYNISSEAYHEISMNNPEIPSAYSLHKEAKQMNTKCIIQQTPG